jgi:hypothetical protein
MTRKKAPLCSLAGRRLCRQLRLQGRGGVDSRLSFFLAGIHTVSAIETILDKDRFTLEELLEEDEVLQVRVFPPVVCWAGSSTFFFLFGR